MSDVSDQGEGRPEGAVESAGHDDLSGAPVPTSPESVKTAADSSLLGVLRELDQAGWAGQFMAIPDRAIRCLTCRTEFPAEGAPADEMRRLEGASDPADMVIVVLLTCPECATRGSLTAHYGPEASAEESDVVAVLSRTPAGGRPGDHHPGTMS